MRVAIYYDHRYGRNDGPPLYWKYALTELGLDVVHLIPKGDTRRDTGMYNAHFWVDWGEDALHYPEFHIPKDGGKTIYVASDTHLDDGYRFRKAREFDYVFFNQKRAMEEYIDSNLNEGVHQNVSWLAHAFEPAAYPNIETLKKFDVCFIGHCQDPDNKNYNGFSRAEALDVLFKEFPNFYYGSRHPAYPDKNLFEEAAHHFSESKIVFNTSIKDDINMRVFEVLGTGSLLLTNYLPTLKDLFENKKHLVAYRDLNEMVKLARYYIDHDGERNRIAQAGYNEVINKHTYEHRAMTVLDLLGVTYKKPAYLK